METNAHTREAAHPTPRTYIKIAALLAIITAIEVWIFYIEALKGVLVPVFIVLSAVKFILVAMFYMHLKYDERLFSWLFVAGLILATFVILALMTLFGALL
jgi:cytochrome c oxidase subunit 4